MLSIYYKSQTQPDGGEGCSGMASGGSLGPGEKAALPRQSTANARDDVQKPSQAGLVGRVRNTGLSPLSIISQAGILGARVQKDTCLPREVCRVSVRTDRTVRGEYRVAEISRGHISRRKRAPQRGEDSPRSRPERCRLPNGRGK